MKKFFTNFGLFFHRFFYSFSLVWKTNRFLLFVMIGVAIIRGATPVVSSVLSKNLMNILQSLITERLGGGRVEFSHSGIIETVVFLFSFRFLNRLGNRLQNYTSRITGEQVVKTVKVAIIKKSKEIDMSSYDTPEFYEKLENANREAGTRPVSILQNTFNVISTSISMISYLVILFSAMPIPALLVVAVTIPSAIVNFVYRKKNANYIKKKSKSRREMNYYAERAVNRDVAKEVRIYNLTDTFLDSYKKSFNYYYKGLKKLIVHENLWIILFIALSVLTNCGCYLYIAKLVFDGTYMIGDFSLYTSALTSISNEISTLINTSATIYEGTLFIDNLISFLDEKPKVVTKSDAKHIECEGKGHSIEFKNVSFSYPGFDKKVLNNVNVKINSGDNVTLVGLNGAGKTTFIKLMTRLYDPTEGEIFLDGENIKNYDLKDVYNLFGIIFQDFGKYAYTVKENIEFGAIDKEVEDERIVQSAREANADEFIEKLPDKFDTPLTRSFLQNGTELSGGQWQKIAIARSFYGMKDILILDEPTAALDPIAENEIYSQFRDLSDGKTTLFVSHRLSSAVTSDKIIVMENGQIVEEGTHKELMDLGEKYYTLFTTQAEKYMPDCVSEI